MQSLKPITKLKQKEIFSLSKKLSKSPNPWQRRLSLVLLENYTRDALLKKEIESRIKFLENDGEYYVKKAVVWLNRNFIKGR
jgi:3-methyladenine DNA glycosylase AlkD